MRRYHPLFSRVSPGQPLPSTGLSNNVACGYSHGYQVSQGLGWQGPGSTDLDLRLPDERDLLVDSPLYSAVNTRRPPLQDECAYKCDDWLFALLQFAPVYPQVRIRRNKDQTHRMIVSFSSRTFSKGGGVGRRELCLRTGEQQRQAYYLRGGVLIIDNFAHSSRTAAIVCFAFVTTLQDRPPASMSIRNVVSSVFCTALSALCLLHPLQYPVHNPRGCHSSHPQLHLRPSSVEKHLFSGSSHCHLESQHGLRVYTPLPPGA